MHDSSRINLGKKSQQLCWVKGTIREWTRDSISITFPKLRKPNKDSFRDTYMCWDILQVSLTIDTFYRLGSWLPTIFGKRTLTCFSERWGDPESGVQVSSGLPTSWIVITKNSWPSEFCSLFELSVIKFNEHQIYKPWMSCHPNSGGPVDRLHRHSQSTAVLWSWVRPYLRQGNVGLQNLKLDGLTWI